jgi:hypothetical protein
MLTLPPDPELPDEFPSPSSRLTNKVYSNFHHGYQRSQICLEPDFQRIYSTLQTNSAHKFVRSLISKEFSLRARLIINMFRAWPKNFLYGRQRSQMGVPYKISTITYSNKVTAIVQMSVNK